MTSHAGPPESSVALRSALAAPVDPGAPQLYRRDILSITKEA